MNQSSFWLAILAAALLGSCNRTENPGGLFQPQTNLSGTYVEKTNGERMRARWIKAATDPGEMSDTLDFHSDGTVRRTFLQHPSEGTYSLDGGTVHVSINSRDARTQQWQVYAHDFTREGEDLLDEQGNRYVRSR